MGVRETMKYPLKVPLWLKSVFVAGGSMIVVGALALLASAQYRNERDFVQSDPQTTDRCAGRSRSSSPQQSRVHGQAPQPAAVGS
jgi:hypothetical protein